MSSSNIPSVEDSVHKVDNSNNTSSAPSNEKPWTFKTGVLLASLFFAILNSAPFSDAARFRKAIDACEKNLPRAQHCDVQGVVVQVPIASAIAPKLTNP